MATSSGRSVGRPPHEHSQQGHWEPGDEIAGGWTVEHLIRMNDRFVERLKRAFARGLETRPQEIDDEARQRRERAARMNSGDPTCAHCSNAFVPICSTQKYCQAAYHQRLLR